MIDGDYYTAERSFETGRARTFSDADLTIVPSPLFTATEVPTPTINHRETPDDIEAKPAGPSPAPQGPSGGWLAHKMSGSQEIIFNITICVVQLIPQACLTTCFPIMQILAHDFNIVDSAILPWIVAANALSFGTTILLAGRLGDIFGHRNIVVLGFAWLAMFSILGGLSRYVSYEVFFVARAMQGLGSAMMNPNALGVLGRCYPPNSKGKIIAFSAFGLCAPLGAYTGMLFSALFGQLSHWSWSFYKLAIVAVVVGVVAAFILPSPPKTPKQMLSFGKKLKSMDWIGGLTGVGGLIAIQVSLIEAPVLGWETQWVFMLLAIGFLLFAFVVVVELKLSFEPLVPFQLLNGNVAFVLAAMACGWGTFGIWSFYLWRFMLNIWHDTPLLAALRVLPIVPVALLAAALTAVSMRKTQPAWILFGALAAFMLGPTFLAANLADTVYWKFTFISLLVMPFGMDMSFPSANFVMSNSLPMDKQGVAGSLVTTVVNYSISLGLSIASTVEVHLNDDGEDVMRGIRGSCFFGIGLGALGVIVCAGFVLKDYLLPASLRPLGCPSAVSVEPSKPQSGRKRNSKLLSDSVTTMLSIVPSQVKMISP